MSAHDDIDRAIAYCAVLDPAFASRIEGASGERIGEVEDLAGHPLTKEHRAYLRRLGTSTGGLDFGPYDSSAARLERVFAATYGKPEPGFELFAVGVSEPHEDIYLVRRDDVCVLELLSTRMGVTHATLAGDQGRTVAGSIAELMCRSMLWQAVVARMPWRRTLALPLAAGPQPPEPPMLAGFDAVAAELRLPLLWFSSTTARVAATDTMVAIARQGPSLRLLVTVAGDDEAAVGTAGRTLAQQLGLVQLPSA